jgi:hypothetical protein
VRAAKRINGRMRRNLMDARYSYAADGISHRSTTLN